MKPKKYIALGKLHKVHHTWTKVIKSNKYMTCKKCAFKNTEYCDNYKCTEIERKDGNSIIFIKLFDFKVRN